MKTLSAWHRAATLGTLLMTALPSVAAPVLDMPHSESVPGGVHIIALICGGLGLLSVYFIHDKYVLWLSMAGVGIAWASILSMPYVILSGSVPAARMGVYMGVFNLFIVIPQAVMSFVTPYLIKHVIGDDPLSVVMLGGFSLLVAALSMLIVRDVAGRVPVGAVISGDEHEPLTVQGTAQPVPSTGLIDGEGK